MKMTELLIKNPVILSGLNEQFYSESVLRIIKELGNLRVCYVSLNKTTGSSFIKLA